MLKLQCSFPRFLPFPIIIIAIITVIIMPFGGGKRDLVGIRLQNKVPPTIVSIVGKKRETLKILKLGSNKYVEAFIFEK